MIFKNSIRLRKFYDLLLNYKESKMDLENFRFRREHHREFGVVIFATVDVNRSWHEFKGNSQALVGRDHSGRWYFVRGDKYLPPSLNEWCELENKKYLKL